MRICNWHYQWELRRKILDVVYKFREQKRDRWSKDNFKALIRNVDNTNRIGRMRIWSSFKENIKKRGLVELQMPGWKRRYSQYQMWEEDVKITKSHYGNLGINLV